MDFEKFDKFYGKIWIQGTSHIITIPDNIMKGAGLNKGDELIVMVKRRAKAE